MAQVALLAVVCVLIVVVTELALNAFLINQLDSQLSDATRRAGNAVGGPPPPGGGGGGYPPRPDGPRAPGQAAGTFTAVIRDGRFAFAERLTRDGTDESLAEADRAVLTELPVDGKAYTRDLGSFGEYRVTAEYGRPGDVVITGLPLTLVDQTLLSVGFILGGIALAGLLAAAAAGAVIVRRSLAPLDRVAATASRVAELPLDRGEIDIQERVEVRDADPGTEVGQVGIALNRLLDSMTEALVVRHASETRVRQFVADASHELRTPLSAVRGYAELVRRSGGPVSAEVAHALGRVESEAARMTTLVEDLLLLARLDSGRPLENEPVDLSRLVVDVASDARIAGPDHVWRLDLPSEPLVVAGDSARLHQVLANLMSNARTHTPPGTTVSIGLSTKDQDVLVEVADDGPGIPESLLPNVFQRFARGAQSRSRATGSTGLGLAIVAAVVHAHRGEVTVASRPGRTAFTVRLPVVADAVAQGTMLPCLP